MVEIGALAATLALVWAGTDDIRHGEARVFVFHLGILLTWLGTVVIHGWVWGASMAIGWGIFFAIGVSQEHYGMWSRGDTHALALCTAAILPAPQHIYILPLSAVVMIAWSKWRLEETPDGGVPVRLIPAFIIPPLLFLLSSV